MRRAKEGAEEPEARGRGGKRQRRTSLTPVSAHEACPSSSSSSSTSASLPFSISDVAHAKTYGKRRDVWTGGFFRIQEAFLQYEVHEGVVDIFETFVPPELRGRGTAALLCEAAFASDELRASPRAARQRPEGVGETKPAAAPPPLLQIRPSCSYVSDTFLPRRRAALLASKEGEGGGEGEATHSTTVYEDVYACRLVSQ